MGKKCRLQVCSRKLWRMDRHTATEVSKNTLHYHVILILLIKCSPHLFFSGSTLAPFCNRLFEPPYQLGCTVDRSVVSVCNLIDYGESPPPSEYQVIWSHGIGLGFVVEVNNSISNMFMDKTCNVS